MEEKMALPEAIDFDEMGAICLDALGAISLDEQLARPKIWEGSKRVFLVCDETLKDYNAPLLEFLRKEGYTLGHYKGNYGCSWIYVDITSKQYAYGMPGIELMGAIGDHAITINEFMTIYNIYKKYENKSLFVFHKERFDYDKTTIRSFEAKDPSTTSKIQADAIKKIDPNAKEVRLSLGVVDYDAPYLIHHTVNLYIPTYGNAKLKVSDFLSRIDLLQTITIEEQKITSV